MTNGVGLDTPFGDSFLRPGVSLKRYRIKTAKKALVGVVVFVGVGCGRHSDSPAAAGPVPGPEKPTENLNRVPGPGVGVSCYLDTRFCVEAQPENRAVMVGLKETCSQSHAPIGQGTCTQVGHVASCVFTGNYPKIRYYNMTREEARGICEDIGGGKLVDRY